MSSKTQVLNVALGRIGSTKQVANIATDRSKEAILARLFFDDEVAFILRDFPWPFATAYVALALVAGGSGTPANNDWQYSYRYPSDCVFARRIATTAGRNNANPPPFRVGRDSQGKLIYTNEATPTLEYTMLVTDTAEFDGMFTSMLAWRLGADLAPGSSRIGGMVDKCMNAYEFEKSKATARSLNEGQQEEPIESEMLRSRD